MVGFVEPPPGDTPSGQELLTEFMRYGHQRPFEEIVRRYAGMVYNTALRVTKDKHDAEDAAQAVFLTLALQAKKGTEIKALGPWLQQVAKRLSLDIRRGKKRRDGREQRHHDEQSWRRQCLDEETLPSADLDELKIILHDELQKLPSKYRLPLILHYFGGLSRDEMAAELNCNTSTLGVRIFRGRALLAERLRGRGMNFNPILLPALLSAAVRGTISQAMVAATSRAAAAIAAGHDGAGLVSHRVIRLTRRAATAALYGKAKIALASLLLLSTVLAAAARAVGVFPHIDLQSVVVEQVQRLVRPLLQPLSAPRILDKNLVNPWTSPLHPLPIKFRVNGHSRVQPTTPLADGWQVSPFAAPATVPQLAIPELCSDNPWAASGTINALTTPDTLTGQPLPLDLALASQSADDATDDDDTADDSPSLADVSTPAAASGDWGAGGGGGGAFSFFHSDRITSNSTSDSSIADDQSDTAWNLAPSSSVVHPLQATRAHTASDQSKTASDAAVVAGPASATSGVAPVAPGNGAPASDDNGKGGFKLTPPSGTHMHGAGVHPFAGDGHSRGQTTSTTTISVNPGGPLIATPTSLSVAGVAQSAPPPNASWLAQVILPVAEGKAQIDQTPAGSIQMVGRPTELLAGAGVIALTGPGSMAQLSESQCLQAQFVTALAQPSSIGSTIVSVVPVTAASEMVAAPANLLESAAPIGTATVVAVPSVPEPASLAVVAMAGAMLLRRRRAR